ncbi:MAG: signal peptidase, endoplasmic reticulum-type [Parcubacteria group bacterium Gr01-1014_29]|nr:MAG: signal peptidase, endoplasmic reticulum-type [Parcubacteria group bacterium Gr01-1014_29]
MKQLGTYGYYLFFGALIFVALVVVASAFPIKGNIQIKVVESGSMEPAIKTGSVALIKPVTSYKIGDIITFEGNFKNAKGQRVPTTHRIVEMRVDRGNPIYITKGDANEEQDTREATGSQVIGKVLFSIPYIGYAVETARQPYGFAALIIVPALLIIGDQAQKIWREIKKIRGRKEHETNSTITQ